MSILYFEDFHAGQVIDLGSVTVSAEEIVAFARQFDPQPFHLDEAAGKASHFGGLVASGWHTCSLVMRRLVEGLLVRAASHGSPGMDEVRWLKPLRPGDTLHVKLEITDTVPSRSRPDRGVLHCHFTGTDQHGDRIVSMKGIGMYGRRPRDAAAG